MPHTPEPSTAQSERTLEELDFTVQCQWEVTGPHDLCGEEASWLGMFPCCDDGYFVCDYHQVAAEIAMATGSDYHVQCGHQIPEMDWIAV